MIMGISENECTEKMSLMEKTIGKLSKLVKMSADMAVIPTITGEWQYKAYARLKRSQEISNIVKFLLKIISEISVITGAITVVAQVFL